MVTEDMHYEAEWAAWGNHDCRRSRRAKMAKNYQLPTEHEIRMAAVAERDVRKVFEAVPFGLLEEPTPVGRKSDKEEGPRSALSRSDRSMAKAFLRTVNWPCRWGVLFSHAQDDS